MSYNLTLHSEALERKFLYNVHNLPLVGSLPQEQLRELGLFGAADRRGREIVLSGEDLEPTSQNLELLFAQREYDIREIFDVGSALFIGNAGHRLPEHELPVLGQGVEQGGVVTAGPNQVYQEAGGVLDGPGLWQGQTKGRRLGQGLWVDAREE